MELKLRIVPQTLEQISLIAYMGQSGSSRDSSDHISVTFVRGYIMLTWDLGSGVRRIFTNSPLNARPHKVHTIQIGRRGRDSWLYVEGVGNVTGRAAGANTRLDVSPLLYIGKFILWKIKKPSGYLIVGKINLAQVDTSQNISIHCHMICHFTRDFLDVFTTSSYAQMITSSR